MPNALEPLSTPRAEVSVVESVGGGVEWGQVSIASRGRAAAPPRGGEVGVDVGLVVDPVRNPSHLACPMVWPPESTVMSAAVKAELGLGAIKNDNMAKELFWNSRAIGQIDDFWYFMKAMDATAAFQSGFQPRSDDLLLTSFTKTGTTWLKALCYNILDKEVGEDLLAEKNPHEVVPTLGNTFLKDQFQRMLLGCSSP
ncbi:unnamed protein product [Linum tenue]|uniref:Sulfotransferase n=1 Tax=Linum tenue TaxID=586396 RepID=A0AAV0RLF3_9ROSI|nr:unnamed protein product [Linum tenue]